MKRPPTMTASILAVLRMSSSGFPSRIRRSANQPERTGSVDGDRTERDRWRHTRFHRATQLFVHHHTVSRTTDSIRGNNASAIGSFLDVNPRDWWPTGPALQRRRAFEHRPGELRHRRHAMERESRQPSGAILDDRRPLLDRRHMRVSVHEPRNDELPAGLHHAVTVGDPHLRAWPHGRDASALDDHGMIAKPRATLDVDHGDVRDPERSRRLSHLRRC
jgi:hypothetical protein